MGLHEAGSIIGKWSVGDKGSTVGTASETVTTDCGRGSVGLDQASQLVRHRHRQTALQELWNPDAEREMC